MSICVNTEMCTGCGLCVEGCPPQAIHLTAGKAVIEPELCTACGVCVKVCAMGAIAIVEPPALIRPAEVQAPVAARVARNTSEAPGKIVLLTGIAATLIERQVVPCLMDAFIAALERRLARPGPTPATLVCQGSEGRGRRCRYRRRGDRSR